MRAREFFGAVVLSTALCAPLRGQEPAPAPAAPPAPAGDVVLKFEREVFDYQAAGRRDPFTPLVGAEGVGPRFEQLSLSGIIHSRTPGRSVALFVDGSGRIYRVRNGDRVGNVRVVDIGPRRVIVAVENFGRARQEIIELKRRGAEGAAQ